MKKIGLMLGLLVVIQGCSTFKVDSGSPQSNLVVHPYYEYHGVKVEPSHNWYMGNRKGLASNEKLRFGDDGKGAFFDAAESIDRLSVDGDSIVSNPKSDGACNIPSPELVKEWVVHFDSASTSPLDFESLRGEFDEVEVGRIEVSGHTDDVGSDRFNMELSKKRAVEVGGLARDVWPGVDVKTSWSGECPSAVLNVDDETRALNRRVSIRAYKDK